MKKVLLFITGLLYVVHSLSAQLVTYNVNGVIKSASSESPLEGVTLILQKSGTKALSDAKGSFTIVQSVFPDTLIVSHIGFITQFIPLDKPEDKSLNIQLEETTTQLKEIIVSTGYQQIPRERATGSFDFIDNTTLNQQVGSNILNRIDGVTNAVLFPKQNLQKGPNFMIRGLSTINGPKDPLIIVDNFPYEGDINNINPNDVESVTILKDAAAASIWGARAGNGVVVITTKKGKFNKPLSVNFNTNIAITEKPKFFYLRIISSDEYIDLEKSLFNNGYYDRYLSNIFSYPALSPVIEVLNKERNGLINKDKASRIINRYRDINSIDQYNKYIYRYGFSNQYALNFQGGSNNLSYYFSAGYDKNIDQLANTNNRYTFVLKNTYKPFKNLQLSLSAQYSQATSHSGRPEYGSITVGQWTIPYLSLKNSDGSSSTVAVDYRQTYTDTAGAGKLLDWNYYPLEDWKHNITKSKRRDLVLNLGLNYQLIKGLDVDIKYLYEIQSVEERNLEDEKSYAVRDLINRFTHIDWSSGTITHAVPIGGILNLDQTSIEVSNIRAQINFNRTWNKHSLFAIAGSEIRQESTIGNSNTIYGYNDHTLVNSSVDLVNSFPDYITGNYNYIPGGPFLQNKLYRFVSYYGNAAYSFKRKYTISVSGRRDASNIFGVSTNNKWNPLWSAGIAWDISNESFYHSNWLSYIKLRLTYGSSGNTDPARTGVTTLVLNSPIPPSPLQSSRVNQFPNPDLRWEKVKMVNIGIDFQTKKSIITGTIEGYLKNGIDLFGPAPFDPTYGLNNQTSLVRNIANMKGRGIDLTLKSKNIDQNFKWQTNLLLSYNVSKTTSYYVDSSLRSNNFINKGHLISPLPGKPLYSIVAFKSNGLDKEGNPQGYIGKTVSKNYREIVNNTKKEDLIYKPSVPTLFGSIINTVSLKGVSIIVNVSYKFGYYFSKPSVFYTGLFANGATIGSSDYSMRWQKQGDERNTNVPSMIYPADYYRDIFYTYSSDLLDKGGVIRLKYINISYDMARLKMRYLKRVKLYFNASNLGVLWKANRDGIDPGYPGITPPPGKKFAFGIKVVF